MPFDIFKLRPSANTSAAIEAALENVKAAEAEQAALLQQAKAERDRLLLDGTPAALAKAQASVNAAMEPAEQTAIMKQQLEQRLAAALESEKVSAIAKAAADAEEAAEALSAWWIKMRKKLATELAEGVRLRDAASSTASFHQMALSNGQQRYPGQTFAIPKQPTVDGWGWPADLASIVGSVDINRGSLAELLKAGDPQPSGWV